MNRLKNKAYELLAPGVTANAYGEVSYQTVGVAEVMISESSNSKDSTRPDAAKKEYAGITTCKEIRINYKLVNGSDEYLVTSVNNSARFAQLGLTKNG